MMTKKNSETILISVTVLVIVVLITVLTTLHLMSENRMQKTGATSSDGKKPQIISAVDASWAEKYPDMTIVNEWMSAPSNSSKIVVLFGSLKSDPEQGVAQVVYAGANGTITDAKQFLSPEKHGALSVSELGAKDTTMIATDKDGLRWNFQCYNGFDPKTPIK